MAIKGADEGLSHLLEKETKLKLLIADGNLEDLSASKVALEVHGHAVTGASDGFSVLDLLDREPFDAVIADIHLPKLDVFQLCLKIRQSDSTRNLPFIIFIAKESAKLSDHLLRCVGADNCLHKSESTENLLSAVALAIAVKNRSPLAQKTAGVLIEYGGLLAGMFEEKNALLSESIELLTLQGAALEAADKAILITDCDGVIQWVNSAFSNLTGYSPKLAIGSTPRLINSGDHDAQFFNQFWKTIKSGQTYHGEFKNRRKDGKIYYDDQTVTPVKAKDGTVTHFVGIMHDVTERKRADEELRSTHAQLSHLLAHSPVVLYGLKILGSHIVPYMASESVSEM